jgi:hypothetical protein
LKFRKRKNSVGKLSFSLYFLSLCCFPIIIFTHVLSFKSFFKPLFIKAGVIKCSLFFNITELTHCVGASFITSMAELKSQKNFEHSFMERTESAMRQKNACRKTFLSMYIRARTIIGLSMLESVGYACVYARGVLLSLSQCR